MSTQQACGPRQQEWSDTPQGEIDDAKEEEDEPA
jgi:hypothetical protein